MIVAFGLAKTGWTPLRIYHWFLLGIGISMSNLAAGPIVAGWLIALGFRKRATDFEARKFDLMQIGIAVLTIAAVSSLIFAISKGLLAAQNQKEEKTQNSSQNRFEPKGRGRFL